MLRGIYESGTRKQNGHYQSSGIVRGFSGYTNYWKDTNYTLLLNGYSLKYNEYLPKRYLVKGSSLTPYSDIHIDKITFSFTSENTLSIEEFSLGITTNNVTADKKVSMLFLKIEDAGSIPDGWSKTTLDLTKDEELVIYYYEGTETTTSAMLKDKANWARQAGTIKTHTEYVSDKLVLLKFNGNTNIKINNSVGLSQGRYINIFAKVTTNGGFLFCCSDKYYLKIVKVGSKPAYPMPGYNTEWRRFTYQYVTLKDNKVYYTYKGDYNNE